MIVAAFTKVNGRTIREMGRGMKFIKMVGLIKAFLSKINQMAKVFTFGKMEKFMMESGSSLKNTVLEYGKATKRTHMLVSGRTIKPTDMESTSGQMVISTKENGLSL